MCCSALRSAIWTTSFDDTRRPGALSAGGRNGLAVLAFGISRRRIVHGDRAKHPSSIRNILPNLASQMRVAFSNMAANTGSRSPGDELMTRSTSAVAVCCSSDWREFVEQPRVLDGDDGLGGEVCAPAQSACSVKGRTSWRSDHRWHRSVPLPSASATPSYGTRPTILGEVGPGRSAPFRIVCRCYATTLPFETHNRAMLAASSGLNGPRPHHGIRHSSGV